MNIITKFVKIANSSPTHSFIYMDYLGIGSLFFSCRKIECMTNSVLASNDMDINSVLASKLKN